MNINSNYTIRLGNRNIVKIMKGSTVIWEKSTTPVVTPDYLYVQNTSSGTNNITLTKDDTSANTKTLEYSKDLSNWTSFIPTDSVFTVSLNQGEKLYLRGSNGTRPNLTIWGQSNHITGGNVNTLLDYTNPNSVSLPQYAFRNLFNGDLYLTDASNLVLPTTRLSNYCYSYMFHACTTLTATPELPATTLAQNCYYNMFSECTSLTTAPELPATTLAAECYYQMFYGCTSLNSVTTFANDISASDCLYNWLGNVAATGTFNNNGSATYVKNSASGIPTGWTEVKPSTGPDYFYLENVDSQSGNVSFTFNGTPSSDTIQQIEWSKDKTNWTPVTLVANTTTNVPVNANEKVYFRNDSGKLSSASNLYFTFGGDVLHDAGGDVNTLLDYKTDTTTLSINYIFSYLFYNDTNLRNAGNLTLGYTTLSNYCYSSMFRGCSSLTTAPSLPATTMKSSCYRYMFMSCFSLTTAPSLPATTLASYCYNDMFRICTSLTTAPSLPATTLQQNCYDGMFNNCTSLTVAPSLPATTLKESCYSNMFNSCTSLTTAPTLPATTLVNFCYMSMFVGCTSLNSVTTYANNISAIYCINNWLSNVASTGTFHNLGSATYPSGASGIPSGWTEVRS